MWRQGVRGEGRRVSGGAGPRPEGPATSADVAQLAGVSRTQVSYVLNNTRQAHVSEKNRRRILAAAKSLGYQPHHSAQSLRRGFSNEFSVFFPAPYPPRINDMLGTIHEAGLALGCVVSQYSYNSYRDPERKREAFRTLLARKPLGLFCSLLDVTRRDLALAREKGVERILVFDVEPHTDLVTLVLPMEEVGRLAGEHLAGLGHRRIAMLEPSDPVQRRPFSMRLAGMQKALTRFPDAELERLRWPSWSIRPSLTAAREFVATALRDRRRPEALYAHSDDYAFPLLAALREQGIEAPRDMAVLGTDDHPYGELFRPSLSTIRFGDSALGERAVALINSLITGEPPAEQYLRPPVPSLVVRESTTGHLRD